MLWSLRQKSGGKEKSLLVAFFPLKQKKEENYIKYVKRFLTTNILATHPLKKTLKNSGFQRGKKLELMTV